jgi:predicted ArsR family transcriptional regulator
MADEPTRLAILRTLRELRGAGASELAHRLGITPAGVRYHLARLLAGGLIEECPHLAPPRQPDNLPEKPQPEKGQPERGRPERCYRLPLKHAPGNLEELSTALLGLLAELSPAPWDKVAEKLVASPAEQARFQQRLADAIHQLNSMNYQANWEAGPGGPRLRLNNCPYAAIWPEAPDLCRLDQAILSRLTSASAQMVTRTSFSPVGPASCVFEIRPKDP